MKCDVVGRVVSRGSGARRVTFFLCCLGLSAQSAASGGHCAQCTQSLTQFSQRPPLAMPRLSEYELERQANIQRNQELLKSLGIFNAEVAPSRKAVRHHYLLSHLCGVRSVVYLLITCRRTYTLRRLQRKSAGNSLQNDHARVADPSSSLHGASPPALPPLGRLRMSPMRGTT